MSTKIYEAVRFPRTRLLDFMAVVRKHSLAKAADRVEKLMAAVKPEAYKERLDGVVAAAQHSTPKMLEKLHRSLRYELVEQECKRASQSSARDPLFCIDCGWSIWPHKRFMYAIPDGEPWLRDGLKFPKWIEDFCYWNNTDPLDTVTPAVWRRRGAIWESILKRDQEQYYVRFNVVDMKEWRSASDVSHVLNLYA